MTERPDLAETIERFKDTPLRRVTLCLFRRDGYVLLAMKNRGFGKGLWNGIGGKMEETDRNIKSAAIRESIQEIHVIPSGLQQAATLNFYFPHNPDLNQQVTVFETRSWRGTPEAGEEMGTPSWFPDGELPFESMWAADQVWMPRVLKGEKIMGHFLYDSDGHLIENKIEAGTFN